MNKKCGYTKELITKNVKFLLGQYIDAIQHAISQDNLKSKLRPILSNDFHFKSGNINGELSEFIGYTFSRQKEYDSKKTNITVKNPMFSVISFGNKIKQEIHLDETFKIKSIIEGSEMKGGMGYTYNVGLNPIGGKPVISSYYNCCRPIFYGSLLQGGGAKKKSQKGGRLNTSYYLDISAPHLNVQPQYRQYEDLC